MSDSIIAPGSIDELVKLVASEKQILAVGNRTKPALSVFDNANATLVSLRSFSGIIEYEPSEFTFTAQAGTRVSEIEAALAEKNQYLPFDPMLVEAGATIGGTVAAGLSGPGRFRYGGIRDFLLGVRFLSGDGEWINAGGKVVKNAAGFDIPKFLVGSMGRFGVMTELTFKVFPRPVGTVTLRVDCESHRCATDRIALAASSRWELDAIDYRPGEQSLFLRLAGPETALTALAKEIRSLWGDDVHSFDDAALFWRSVRELNWSPEAPIAIKIPITPGQLASLFDSPASDQMHVSVAGNVAWVLLNDSGAVTSMDTKLRGLGIPGLVVLGSCETSRLGQWPSSEMEAAIKVAMDPPARFPMPV